MKPLSRAAAAPLATVLTAAAFVALPSAAPAQATGSVGFGTVSVNAPGPDSSSNRSLNGEWIRIRNGGSSARSLTGWTVRDKAGHVYRFGSLTLRPGASVTLYTGSGTNTRTARYWRSSWHIWNNAGDTAYLRNASGSLVDTCRWGRVSSTWGC